MRLRSVHEGPLAGGSTAHLCGGLRVAVATPQGDGPRNRLCAGRHVSLSCRVRCAGAGSRSWRPAFQHHSHARAEPAQRYGRDALHGTPHRSMTGSVERKSAGASASWPEARRWCSSPLDCSAHFRNLGAFRFSWPRGQGLRRALSQQHPLRDLLVAGDGRLGPVSHGVGREPAAAAVATHWSTQTPAPRHLVAVQWAPQHGVRTHARSGGAVAGAE